MTTQQLALSLPPLCDFEAASFCVGESNQEAWSWIQKWPDWPQNGIVVYGPSGAGKSHLGEIWRKRVMGERWTPREHPKFLTQGFNAPILIDCPLADLTDHKGQFLLEAYNLMRENAVSFLLVALTSPSVWPETLPDLTSRLKALPSVPLLKPDDALLIHVLKKNFNDYQMPFQDAWGDFILSRIERSFAALKNFSHRLNQRCLQEKKKVSLGMIRQLL